MGVARGGAERELREELLDVLGRRRLEVWMRGGEAAERVAVSAGRRGRDGASGEELLDRFLRRARGRSLALGRVGARP